MRRERSAMTAVDSDRPSLSDFPDMVRFRLLLPRESIFFVSWTVDAYEGIGFVRTDDAIAGEVSLFCPVEQEEEAQSLLEALRREGVCLRIVERRGVSFREEKRNEAPGTESEGRCCSGK